MVRDERISRRRVLCLAGGGSAIALAAGCLGTDDPDRDGGDNGADSPAENGSNGELNETGGGPAQNESSDEPAQKESGDESTQNESSDEPAQNETGDGPTGNTSGDGSTDEEESPPTDGNETDPNATDDGDETGGGVALEPNADILLSATTSGWEGVEPEAIASETNPTLELEAGAKYGITWENADGKPHNIEIWNEQEEVVGEHATELVSAEGETQSIEFVATEEMAEYACKIHYDWGHRAAFEITDSK